MKLTFIEHTAECDREGQAVRNWVELWPDHCWECNGWGGHPSPAVSLAPGYFTDFEPCEYCIEEGRCPRCGEDGLESVCDVCGWDQGDPDGKPAHYCYCEMEREDWAEEFTPGLFDVTMV